MRAIRREGLLLDPQRLFEAALIEVAGELSLDEAPAESDVWLTERVRRALRRVRNRDAQWVQRAGGSETDVGPGAFLVEAFRVPESEAAEAALRFHELEQRTRRIFLALTVDGWSLARTSERFGGDARELADAVWEGMHALGLATEEERDRILDDLLRIDSQRGNRP
ncbi:MAG TPA: hypothetical protein ENJ09_00205 [Planctomycetes bacterium]|nr:hypothetical protein [Planctomycetota bacterium]